jgi:hypothetical protein
MQLVRTDSRLRPQGRGGGVHGRGEGREGMSVSTRMLDCRAASVRMHLVRADAGVRLRGRIFTSADSKNRPRVKSRPWGICGRTRTSGRKGRLDCKFYRRTSV